MTDIILSTQNGEPVASSRQIAENFGKEHKHVLDAVKNLVAENSAAKSMFYETTFENRGKQYPMYLMNRDGFSLLVMGFTGKAALEWKLFLSTPSARRATAKTEKNISAFVSL